VNDVIIDNCTKVIVGNVLQFGGLSKFIGFGVHGVLFFKEPKISVTTLLRDKLTPYNLGVHCVAHKTNLAI
jgi:hypothetical protein